MTKRIDLWIRDRTGNKVEGQVEVGQRKEGKQQIDELVDEFDVKQDLSSNAMIGTPNLLEVNERVYGGEESTVQPTTSL